MIIFDDSTDFLYYTGAAILLFRALFFPPLRGCHLPQKAEDGNNIEIDSHNKLDWISHFLLTFELPILSLISLMPAFSVNLFRLFIIYFRPLCTHPHVWIVIFEDSMFSFE